jgi:hypothetical protein
MIQEIGPKSVPFAQAFNLRWEQNKLKRSEVRLSSLGQVAAAAIQPRID